MIQSKNGALATGPWRSAKSAATTPRRSPVSIGRRGNSPPAIATSPAISCRPSPRTLTSADLESQPPLQMPGEQRAVARIADRLELRALVDVGVGSGIAFDQAGAFRQEADIPPDHDPRRDQA